MAAFSVCAALAEKRVSGGLAKRNVSVFQVAFSTNTDLREGITFAGADMYRMSSIGLLYDTVMCGAQRIAARDVIHMHMQKST